jgi:hypothetical protein
MDRAPKACFGLLLQGALIWIKSGPGDRGRRRLVPPIERRIRELGLQLAELEARPPSGGPRPLTFTTVAAPPASRRPVTP